MSMYAERPHSLCVFGQGNRLYTRPRVYIYGSQLPTSLSSNLSLKLNYYILGIPLRGLLIAGTLEFGLN